MKPNLIEHNALKRILTDHYNEINENNNTITKYFKKCMTHNWPFIIITCFIIILILQYYYNNNNKKINNIELDIEKPIKKHKKRYNNINEYYTNTPRNNTE